MPEETSLESAANTIETIKTRSVSENEYFHEALDPSTFVKIKQGDWQELNAGTQIVNEGAGPCLIIYVINKRDGTVISGHFPDMNKERQDMFLQDKIANL